MDIGTISSRYAKALFSLAKEKGLETRVYDDMKMLADSFSLEPGLRVALGNPILPAEEKLKLLTAAGGIEVSDLYERFMHLVLEHKRESLLLFMAHIYIHLYRKDKRITRVQFSTAVPGKRGSESTSPEQAEGRDRQHHRILRHCTTGADRRFSPAYRELPDRCQLCDTATGYP